jgi:hypothetical protein
MIKYILDTSFPINLVTFLVNENKLCEKITKNILYKQHNYNDELIHWIYTKTEP